VQASPRSRGYQIGGKDRTLSGGCRRSRRPRFAQLRSRLFGQMGGGAGLADRLGVMDATALYRAGKKAWPDVEIARSVFASRLSGEAKPAYAADVFLAIACATGNKQAIRHLASG